MQQRPEYHSMEGMHMYIQGHYRMPTQYNDTIAVVITYSYFNDTVILKWIQL